MDGDQSYSGNNDISGRNSLSSKGANAEYSCLPEGDSELDLSCSARDLAKRIRKRRFHEMAQNILSKQGNFERK